MSRRAQRNGEKMDNEAQTQALALGALAAAISAECLAETLARDAMAAAVNAANDEQRQVTSLAQRLADKRHDLALEVRERLQKLCAL